MLSSLDYRGGRSRIVMIEGKFPSVRYVAESLGRRLGAEIVVVPYRPGVGIRLAPHFYTAEEELDRAFEVLDEVRASGAWARWRERPVPVT